MMKKEKSSMANLKISEVEKVLKLAEKYEITSMEFENLAFNRVVRDKSSDNSYRENANLKLADKEYVDPIEKIQDWIPDYNPMSRDPEA